MANVITTKLDLDGKGFLSQLRAVQTSIQSAEGATGKLKAGLSGMGQVLQANAAEAATAAATALATFGIRAAEAFQQAALEAKKFGDATGLSSEEASRLVEVAGDVGVEVGTIQGAVQKFNKAIADNKLGAFNDELVRSANGSVDTYESFINVATAIGNMGNAQDRAAAAQAAFGRSYGEIAELMAMDAEELRGALEGVSDAQVFDAEEVRKAEEYRAAIDGLRDAFTQLQNSVGGELVGNLTLVANAVQKVIDVGGKVPEALKDSFLGAINPLSLFKQTVEGVDEALNGIALDNITAEFDRQTASLKDAAEASNAYLESLNGLSGEQVSAAENHRRSAEAARYQAQATQALEQRLIEYTEAANGIPADIYSEIRAALNSGDLARAEALLNEVARSRIVQVGIAITNSAVAGAAAGAGKSIGQGISSAIAAAVAGASMPSSVGGGGGGGGGGSSPAETEIEKWDDAVAKLYEYGRFTREEAIRYYEEQMAAEDELSDRRLALYRKLQAIKAEIAAEDEARRKEEEAAAKKAEEEEKKRLKEIEDAKKKADQEAEARAKRAEELAAVREGARLGVLAGFSGLSSVTNVYTNSPDQWLEKMRGWERNNGPAWQTGDY